MNPDERRSSRDRPAGGPERIASFRDALGWLRDLEDAMDDARLGERLLNAAVAPWGAGADRARLYAWDAAAGRLVQSRMAGPTRVTLAANPNLEEVQVEPAVQGPVELDPDRLDPVAARAWSERGTAWGEASRDPIAVGGGAELGAVAWRTAHDREWLLLADYDRSADDDARAAFEALADAARLAGRALEWRQTAQRRGGQKSALAEFLGTLAGAGHLLDGMKAGARAALLGTGAAGAAVWRREEQAPPRLELTAGGLGERESLARALHPMAECVAESGRSRLADRAVDEASLPAEAAARFGRVACVPLLAHGRCYGVLGVFDTCEPPGATTFDAQDDEFLRAVADGIALLLEQAERGDALRLREQQLKELRARSRRRERLATLGELAVRLAGEARHPLASIGSFARRAHRELPETDARREYLDVVIRETERLERLLAEPIASGALEPPRFRVESLNAVLQDVLPGVGERLVRRRVRLLKRLDPESPRLLLDAERIRQVLRNVVDHAVDSVPIGGRVRVESRTVRDHVVVEIAFDARREPGGLLERLFVPFEAATPGQGLGLGVADQIVREHGGEIRLRSDAEWGAAVLITLPIRGNGDRRSPGADRRLSREDRRHRVGGG